LAGPLVAALLGASVLGRADETDGGLGPPFMTRGRADFAIKRSGLIVGLSGATRVSRDGTVDGAGRDGAAVSNAPCFGAGGVSCWAALNRCSGGSSRWPLPKGCGFTGPGLFGAMPFPPGNCDVSGYLGGTAGVVGGSRSGGAFAGRCVWACCSCLSAFPQPPTKMSEPVRANEITKREMMRMATTVSLGDRRRDCSSDSREPHRLDRDFQREWGAESSRTRSGIPGHLAAWRMPGECWQENCKVARKGSGPCFRPTLFASGRVLLTEKWTRPQTLQFSCECWANACVWLAGQVP